MDQKTLQQRVDYARRTTPGVRTARELARIHHRDPDLVDRIRNLIGDPNCSPHISEKVARALSEHRIPEHVIWQLEWPLRKAHNRGAYFVAAVKRAFADHNLAWEEEHWNDA